MILRRRLTGIDSGAAVSLEVEQAGVFAFGQTGPLGWGVSPPPDPQPGAGDLTVSVSVTTPALAISPLPVRFEASTSEVYTDTPASGSYADAYDRNFNKPEYVWTFGEAGNYTAPQNMVSQHLDKARGTGQFISRVFRCPEGSGSVDVSYRCDVYWPDGSYGSASGVVTVNDHASSYTPAQTFVVSSDAGETWSGAPAHDAANRCTSWADVVSAIENASGDRVKVAFKRGDTVLLDDTVNLDTAPDVLLTEWGSGAKPVLDHKAQNFGGIFQASDGGGFRGKALVCDNLRFQGGWNPEIEWNPHAPNNIGVGALFGMDEQCWQIMTQCVDDASVMTFNPAAKTSRTGNPLHIFFEDSTKSNFKDFLVLSNRDNQLISVIGSAVVQNVNALSGSENRGTSGFSLYARNAHNFLRVNSEGLYVGHSDIFVRHGWTIGYSVLDNHLMRLNRGDIPGFRAVVSCNHIEGPVERQGSDKLLNTDDVTAAFVTGEVVTGQTSGGSVTLVSGRNVGQKNLTVVSWNGTPFSQGEDLHGSSSGRAVVNVTGLNPGDPVELGLEHCNMLFEHNLWTGSPNYVQPLNFNGGGATIRNNIFVTDNVPRNSTITPGASGTFRAFIGLESDSIKPDVADMPFFIYGNTFAVLREDNADNRLSAAGIVEGAELYNHVDVDNNILYVPNSTEFGDTSDGPLDLTSLGFDARNDGYRVGWYRVQGLALGSDVADSAGVTFSYAADDVFEYTPTGSDFGGSPYNRHRIEVRGFSSGNANRVYDVWDGEASVTFNASDFTITNLSGETWESGTEVRVTFDRGDQAMPMDTTYATPAGTLSLYRPQSGAGADQDATSGLVPLTDFLLNTRPGTAHPMAATGTPSRGAVEPA